MSLTDKLRATVKRRKEQVQTAIVERRAGVSMEEMQAAIGSLVARPELLQQIGNGVLSGKITPRQAAALVDEISPTARDIVRRLGGFEFLEYAIADQYKQHRGGIAVFVEGILAAPESTEEGRPN